MDAGQIVLVEGLVILVIVLAIGIHQLWTVRKPPPKRDPRSSDAGEPPG